MELKKLSYDYVSDIAIFANNKKIADNLRDIFPHPYTEKNAQQFVKFCIDTPESKQIHRAIFYDDKPVGVISLTLGEDVYAKSAEIGYWLAEPYWGKGIMTAAVKQTCRIAFGQYNLARLFADVYSYNKKSCKVLEKCGFEMEGVLKNLCSRMDSFLIPICIV